MRPFGEKVLEEPLAFKDAMALAQKGEARGFYQLAICFSAGNGVERNRATGYKYLQKAAEMGYGNAWYVLGRIKQSHIKGADYHLIDKSSVSTIHTYELAGAYLWDGATYSRPITDDETFFATSNCYANAVAAGVDMAKYDLAGIMDLRDHAMKERAAANASRGERTANSNAAKAAFPDLFAEEYPVPASNSVVSSLNTLLDTDPNAYLDSWATTRKHYRQRDGKTASFSRRKQMENELKKKAEAKYDSLRINSICGVEFGKKPPEWYKKPNRKDWHGPKLPKPFRYFTHLRADLTKDGLVKGVELHGDLPVDADSKAVEDEEQNVLAILEKKYNIEFLRGGDGKRIPCSSDGKNNFGRYNISVSRGSSEGVPGIYLSIRDNGVSKKEASLQNLPKSIPAGVGADML